MTVRVKTTEAAIQSDVVEALRTLGFTVIVTSRHVKRCWHCKLYPPSGRGDGVTKGLSDLLVAIAIPGWGVFWKALEVKGPRTAVSPEQQALADAGAITIVRSLDEALKAVGVMT